MHLSMIWIVSLGNVLVFSMINDRKVIYHCLLAFNFSSSVLVLLFNVLCQPLLQKGRLHWWVMLVLNLPLLLDLMICMQATLEGLWVRQLPTTKGTSSLLFLVHAGCASFGLSLAFPICLPCEGFSHRSFIGFLCLFPRITNPANHLIEAVLIMGNLKFKKKKKNQGGSYKLPQKSETDNSHKK